VPSSTKQQSAPAIATGSFVFLNATHHQPASAATGPALHILAPDSAIPMAKNLNAPYLPYFHHLQFD
jgi:hypothetical protein